MILDPTIRRCTRRTRSGGISASNQKSSGTNRENRGDPDGTSFSRQHCYGTAKKSAAANTPCIFLLRNESRATSLTDLDKGRLRIRLSKKDRETRSAWIPIASSVMNRGTIDIKIQHRKNRNGGQIRQHEQKKDLELSQGPVAAKHQRPAMWKNTHGTTHFAANTLQA